MLEADGESRYNTAVLFSPDGKLAGKYRKQKLGHELRAQHAGRRFARFRYALWQGGRDDLRRPHRCHDRQAVL